MICTFQPSPGMRALPMTRKKPISITNVRGGQVSAGQPILEMDLDYLNANARSMISPVVCSNIDDFSGLIIKAQGHVVAGQTPLYEIKK